MRQLASDVRLVVRGGFLLAVGIIFLGGNIGYHIVQAIFRIIAGALEARASRKRMGS